MRMRCRRIRASVVAAIACVMLGAYGSLTARYANADTGQIAYIANDRAGIHFVQADGSGDRQVVGAVQIGNLAWSPDGKLLAYTTTAPPQVDTPQHIYIYDTGSGHITEVKSTTGTYGPIAFFPDGKRLAAIDNTSEVPICRGGTALSIDLETGKATPLVRAGCNVTALQVIADGAALIATEHGSGPPGHTWNVSLTSSGEVTMAADADCVQNSFLNAGGPDPSCEPFLQGAGVTSAAVSADNQILAYVLNHDYTNADLVVASRDGSNPNVVWREQLDGVAIAPDGGRLVVTIRNNGSVPALAANEDIWVAGINGSAAHKVAASREPVWRPGQSAPVVPSAPGVAPQSTPQSGAAGETPKPSAGAATPQSGGSVGNRGTGSSPLGAVSCSSRLLGQGTVGIACSNGVRYDFTPQCDLPAAQPGCDKALAVVNALDSSHPDIGTHGPWQATQDPDTGQFRWFDPDRQLECQFETNGVDLQCSPSSL